MLAKGRKPPPLDDVGSPQKRTSKSEHFELRWSRTNGPPPPNLAAGQLAAAYEKKSTALFDLLKVSTDSPTRHAAAIALVHMGQLRGMTEEHFERIKENDDERVRYWASLACKLERSMPTPKLAEETAAVLASNDPIARYAALVALVHLGDAGALYARRVACLLEDSEPSVRAEAARAVAFLARDKTEDFRPNTPAAFLPKDTGDGGEESIGSPRLREGDPVYRGFRSPKAGATPEYTMLSEAARAAAASNIGTTGPRDAARRGAFLVASDAISPASNGNPGTDKNAKKTEYLARTDAHRRVAMLIPAVGGKAAVACSEIRSALVLRNHQRFLAKIASLLQDSEAEVRSAAAWALGELSAISQLRAIAALYHREEARFVKDVALAALCRFGKEGETALLSEKRRAADKKKKNDDKNGGVENDSDSESDDEAADGRDQRQRNRRRR